MVFGPRFLIQAGFIIAVAVVAGIEQVGTWSIIGLVAGEVAWDAVLLPGNRVIQIFDANNVEMYRKTIPIQGDQFFSIQMDPKLGVLLVPVKAAPQPPGQKPPVQKPK